MAGKIKQMIDTIISQRGQENPTLMRIIKTKIILKGINPDNYSLQSDDDPAVISKLKSLMQEI